MTLPDSGLKVRNYPSRVGTDRLELERDEWADEVEPVGDLLTHQVRENHHQRVAHTSHHHVGTVQQNKLYR